MANGEDETRTYLFQDSLQSGAQFWKNTGSVGVAGAGDPVFGGSGSSIKVVSDAWSQNGIYKPTVISSETAYLHLEMYRAPGSDGLLVIRHGGGWTSVGLNAANYGLWTIEGIASADDLNAIPVGTWAHVTINLAGLIGVGTEFNAFSIFGIEDNGNTYFLDNVYFSSSASTGGGPANAAPVAVADTYSTAEDVALSVPVAGVLANDTDADGNVLTAVVQTGPTHGSVVLNANGSFVYTPTANYNGTDSFTYVANDGTDNSAPTTVTITVSPVNDAPVGAADAYSTNQDVALTVPVAGVLANDADVDGNALTAVVQTGPAHGVLALNANGSFTYTPTAGYKGADSFTYVANDGIANSAPVTVAITVNAVNHAPVAIPEIYQFNEDTVLSATTFPVLANDTDADGDALTAVLQTGPVHGALAFNADGTFIYTPNANYNGTDTFTYVANDGALNSAPVTVQLRVLPVNDAPVVAAPVADQVATAAAAFSFVAPAGTFTDADGDMLGLSATLSSGAALPAWLAFDPETGTFTGTPGSGDVGPLSVRLTANDGNGGVVFDDFVLAVGSGAPTNSAPVGATDSYATNEDVALTIPAAGVLANDTDADGDALTAVVQTGPASGTLALNANGSFVYTPNANFNGADSFTYVANDGAVSSAPTTVSIAVNPVADSAQIAFGLDGPLVPLDGADVRANTSTNGIHEHSGVAALGDGGFVVVWESSIGAKSQRFDASGQPAGSETLIGANGNGHTPSVAALAGGGYVVAWSHPEFQAATQVFTQVFDVDGATVGSQALITGKLPPYANASVAGLSDGGFSVSWAEATPVVKTQKFDASGQPVGAVTIVSFDATPAPLRPDAAGLPDGGYIVTWSRADGEVVLQHYDAAGASVGSNVLVNSNTANSQQFPSVAVLADGGYVVVWHSSLQDGSERGVYAQRFGAGGSPVGVETLVNTFTTGDQSSADIAALPDGGYVVTWTSIGQDGSGAGVYAQRFAADGSAIGTEMRLNSITAGSQEHKTLANGDGIAVLADGTLIQTFDGVFQGDEGVYFRRFETANSQASITASEDTVIALSIAVTSPDSGETIGQVVLSGLPGGSILSAGTPNVDGSVWTFDGPPPANLTLTPPASYNGEFSLTVSVTTQDGAVTAVTASQVNVVVLAVNDAPVVATPIADQSAATSAVFSFSLPAATFTDIDTDDLSLVARLSNGAALPAWLAFDSATGTFSGTPDAGDVGQVTVRVTADDGHGGVVFDDFVLTVSAGTPTNSAPVGVADSYATNEDVALTVPVAGVLANDTDIDGNPLTAAVVTGPAHGALAFNANGSFVYTPNANYNGADSFTYRANDGALNSAPTTVSITVNAVNDIPVALPEIYQFNEDTVLSSGAFGLLLNDSDVDGDALTAVLQTGPAHGVLALNANGAFTYTPNANFNGEDTFTYVARDGLVNSAPATVTLRVLPVNDAPVVAAPVADQSATAAAAFSLVVPASTFSDVDGDVLGLTASLSSGAALPSWLGFNAATRAFSGTPGAGDVGAVTVRLTASDGHGGIVFDDFVLTVGAGTPTNTAPVAVADAYATNEDVALSVPAAGVLANDADADGNALTAVVQTGPAHGSVVLNANGSFVYTPTANYNGTDSFTYRANDGTANSALATVTITVNAVNDAPVAAADSYSTNEDVALSVPVAGVLTNDTDVDGNVLTAVVQTGPAHGSVVLNANGSFVYTPTANYNGTDSFTYRANDGTTNSAPATVTINVAAVNDAPVAVDDIASAVEQAPVTINVLANDTDVDSASLSISHIAGQAVSVGGSVLVGSSSVMLNADKTLTVTPGAGSVGTWNFSYTVTDGAASDVGDVAVTVTAGGPVAPRSYVYQDGLQNGAGFWTNTGSSGNSAPGEPAFGGSGTSMKVVSDAWSQNGFYQFQTLDADHAFLHFELYRAAGADGVLVVRHGNGWTSVGLNAGNYGLWTIEGIASADDLNALAVGTWAHVTVDLASLIGPAASFNAFSVFGIEDNGNTFYLDNIYFSSSASTGGGGGPANTAPVAAGDSYTVAEDGVLTVPAAGVLANDTDANGDALTAVIQSGPTHGSVVLNANGSFTFTPNANYNGSDSFTYRASDGVTTSTPATVAISVSAVNDAPVAAADAYVATKNTVLSVPASGVLANDTDVDGNSLTAVLQAGPAHGAVTLNANGSFAYTPTTNYVGTDSFTYRANDGAVNSGLATVTITVNAGGGTPGTLSFAGLTDGARTIDLANGLWGFAARVLPLGDSNTHGWSPAAQSLWEGYRLDFWQKVTEAGFWIDYVGSRQNGPSNLPDKDHYGLSGITATEILQIHVDPLAASAQADVVLLMLGTNDVLFESNQTNVVPNELLAIMQQLEAGKPGGTIVLAPLPPIDASQWGQAAVNVRNAINAQLPGIVQQAQAQGIDAIYLSNLSLSVADVYDGVHLNDAGHAKLAAAWFDALAGQWAADGGAFAGPTTAISGVANVVGSEMGDYLHGDAAANSLNGGGGNDRIEGGVGADLLTGGSGNDTFVYASTADGGDTISDFASGVDRIEVSASGFGGGLVAGGAVTLVKGATPVASGPGGQFLYDTNDGRLFWDGDGNGAGARVLLATLTGAPGLVAADIQVNGSSGTSGARAASFASETEPEGFDFSSLQSSAAVSGGESSAQNGLVGINQDSFVFQDRLPALEQVSAPADPVDHLSTQPFGALEQVDLSAPLPAGPEIDGFSHVALLGSDAFLLE